MEPRIQYAKTADGVSIAFWTLGEGPPLIHMPVMFSHVQLEWEIPQCRRWYERLAEGRTLIRLDTRGMGLSDRDLPGDYSVQVAALDIEAVVDRLGLGRFALLAFNHFAPPAVSYAIQHPDRVSHLVLWHAYAKASDWLRSPRVQTLRAALAQDDWDTYTELNAHILLGWAAGEEASRYSALIRQSITHDTLRTMIPYLNEWDLTSLLPQISTPTLLLHRRDYQLMDVEVARRLVSQIPDARFVLLEGASGAPYLGDVDAALDAIIEFVGRAQTVEPHLDLPSGTAVILFTDIAGSTALTEHLGDVAFRDASRALDAGLRAAIRDAGGTAIDGKLLGDGVLATFPSAAQAIDAARHCHTLSGASELPLHLGIHAGDVIREENNVYGGAVNIASRICALSAPGEILVSDVVRGMARSSAGVEFEDRGEQEMKGVGEPVRVFAVREDA
jgi:class 3 adenylate cyclase